MLYFKDSGDGFYSAVSAELVPVGCVEISFEEFRVQQEQIIKSARQEVQTPPDEVTL